MDSNIQATTPIDSGFVPNIEGQVAVQNTSVQTQMPNETPKAWYESLQQDDLNLLKSRGWDKPGAEPFIFESYKNLEKLRGVPAEKLVKIPDPADKNAWDQVYNKLGRPEAPDKYDYKAPEGVNIDANKVDWFSKQAHALGLNKAQHNEMVNAYLAYENERSKSFYETQQQESLVQMEQLKKDWGNAFSERELLAKQGLASYLDDASSEEAVKQMQQVLGVPAVLRLFAKIGEEQGEGRIPVTSGDRPFAMGPAQAQEKLKQRLEEIKSDPVRLDSYNKGKGYEYDQVQELLRIGNNA